MAKNWMDPAVITNCSKVFGAFAMVLVGVACWDVLSTLWFEWQIITGKRKWRWPMLIYIMARIAMLMHIFAIAINRNALSQVPCTELTFMSKFCDAFGTCASSLILALRTRAVWHRDIKVTVVLAAFFAGQIALWAQTFRYSKAAWNYQRRLCDVLDTAPRALMVSVWAYTMVFDFIILTLCSIRLMSHRNSNLSHILLRDGICYFCFALAANLIQTIMAGLHLNPVMNIITLPFACVVSVIAATTVFRNVFTAYDAFSREGNTPSSKIGSGARDTGFRTGPHILFNSNVTSTNAARTNDFPLGTYRSANDVGTISVHKVVDVSSDDKSASPMRSQDEYSTLTNEKGATIV